MPDVWYENPPGTAPAQGLYSHVGLSRGGTLAFIARDRMYVSTDSRSVEIMRHQCGRPLAAYRRVWN
jgi:hypothetical protein